MKRQTVARIVLTTLLVSAGAIAGDAGDVVEIRVRDHYFSAPATVRILVAVEPNADNRTLRIEADSQDLFRSSEFALSGADEKRLHTVEFQSLPAGHYTLRAEVRSARGVRGMDAQDVTVTGSGLR